MGSEHSQDANARASGVSGGSNPPRLVRGHTIAVPDVAHDAGAVLGIAETSGNTSPGPSVCSDSDLPYISYTVNRPIGDSPKLANKNQPLTRGRSMGVAPKKATPSSAKTKLRPTTAHSIVVVKPGAREWCAESDAEVLRLQMIPMFLPVMRGTLSLPANRDPEVLERLQPAPLQALCNKLQAHMHACANATATEQNSIVLRIKETDAELNRQMALLTERQRRYAKYAEKLSKVHELSQSLNRCHMVLNQTLESMDTLNNILHIDDRLEPFVWTTG